MDVHVEYSQCVFGLKWEAARQHFIQHDPKSIDIGTMIDLIAARLFGGHIHGCPAEYTRGRLGDFSDNTHQSEVRHDCFNIIWQGFIERNLIRPVVKQDVGRFDIPMDDALPVCLIKPSGKPFEEARNLIEWDALFPLTQITQVGSERRSLQIFHDNIGMAINGIEIENLDDVRMPQSRHHSGLALKSLKQNGFFFNKTVQQFDSNRSRKR